MSETTTAIFLWIGFDQERRLHNSDFPQTAGGFVDIPDAIDTFATVVEDWYTVYADMEDPNWPGCFDYEVTEEMGAWLFNNFNASIHDFKTELTRFVAAWMEEDEKRKALWREKDAKLETTK